MRQLVLHVGSIKTGSTSAQTSFATQRDMLAAHGVHYGSFSRNHGAMSRIIRATRRYGMPGQTATPPQRGREANDFATILRAAEEAAAIESGTYFLSSEALLTHSRRNVRLLKDIVDTLFPGFDVKILVYIRHPLAYTISRGQNMVKLRYDTTDDVEDHGYDGELRIGVERYASIFGRDAMIVRSYDAVVAAGRSVQQDMLEAIGHPEAAKDLVVTRSNESVSMNAALIADRVNRNLKAEGVEINANVRRAKKRLFSQIDGPRFAFSAAALDDARPVCQAEADWFAEAYGIDLTPPKVTARETIAEELMPEAEREEAGRRIVSQLKQAADPKPKRKRARKAAAAKQLRPRKRPSLFAKIIGRLNLAR
ncbi:hypothetical protein [Acuticoccus yangtzensis]|uniref:hypothetical protein n=1 Tax=Acuticoccus yangtzensis TaxID=1443441 RepID=UPI0009496206|nr:hypothetical protein [Acuticoccus yangtzensis]